MLFTDVDFLFLFLPIVLLATLAAPSRERNGVLLAASLLFYAAGEPVYVGLLIGSIAFNWVGAIAVDRTRGATRGGWVLAAVVAVNLAALVHFKYARLLVDMLNPLVVAA